MSFDLSELPKNLSSIKKFEKHYEYATNMIYSSQNRFAISSLPYRWLSATSISPEK